MKYLKENYRWLGLLGCLITIIGCFLPYVDVTLLTEGNISTFYDGDGKLAIALVMMTLLLILVNKRRTTIITTISNIFVVFWYPYSDIYKQFKSLSNFITYTFKIGFYVIIIGIIVTLVYALLPNISKKTNKKNIRKS